MQDKPKITEIDLSDTVPVFPGIAKNLKILPPLVITYKNYKGNIKRYTLQPDIILYGKTEYHPEEQYLLRAYDLGDNFALKYFAVNDIISFHTAPPAQKKPALIIQSKEPALRVHGLKVADPHFDPLHRHLKTSELRKFDRDYLVGDYLILAQYIKDVGLTGAYCIRRITHILSEGEWLQPGYCALSLLPETEDDFYKLYKNVPGSYYYHHMSLFYTNIFKQLFFNNRD